MDAFEDNTKFLKQLGEETNHWGAMLVHLMCSKLDDATLARWEEHAVTVEGSTYSVLVEFLQKRAQSLEAISVDLAVGQGGGAASGGRRSQPVSIHTITEREMPQCYCCDNRHY